MEETKTLAVSKQIYYLATALLIIIGVWALGTIAYEFQSLPQNAPNQISVTGSGKAYAKPNVAVASFGITQQGQDIKQLTVTSTAKMNKIISDIKKQGVATNDIQTTEYNITPQYNYTESAGQQFSGYEIDQQVTVKIRDFTKIGDVLNAATADGANNVGNLQFTLDNPDSVQNQAQAQAINNAKVNALALAKQAGLTLVKIVSISPSNGQVPQPIMYNSLSAGGVAAPATPTIEPGQQEVDSSVTITYQVK